MHTQPNAWRARGAAAFLRIWMAGTMLLAACGKTPPAAPAVPAAQASFYAAKFQRDPGVAEMSALGRSLFFDPSLSASGQMACSSCHDPKLAFGPPDAAPVRMGGPGLSLAGVRAVPSLRYLQNVPPFTEHYYESDGNDSEDQGPVGGHTWDGRAQSTHEQAGLPLLSPLEMANADAEQVVTRAEQGAQAQALRGAFGADLFKDRALAYKAVLKVLEVYQQDPAEFYPYSSKYDAWLRHQAELTPQEQRGLALFEDPARGNCAACHPSRIKERGFPGFTDFGFVAIGVPRNAEIPANRDPAHYDLGLCGPERKDLASHGEYCGRFRVPSLRNVSSRKVFFHNGAFHSLEQVLRFYASRDTDPGRWYPRRADGSVEQFDDLPPQYRGNVNREPPFGGKPGGKPALSEQDIRDLLVFLGTLSDGYEPAAVSVRKP
jgi:cytochrome c peroxidase